MSRKSWSTPFTRRTNHKKLLVNRGSCTKSPVSKNYYRKLSERKKCSGKRFTSNRDNHSFERIIKRNPFKNLGEHHKEETEDGGSASRATTHRIILDMGYKCPIPHVTTTPQPETMLESSYLGLRENKWNISRWSKVLFSDDSTFFRVFGRLRNHIAWSLV